MKRKASSLQLALKYSLPPSFYQLCGPARKEELEIIRKFISSDLSLIDIKELKKLEVSFKKFKTAFLYYKKIAKVFGTDSLFSKKIIKAYWLGHPKLKKNPELVHNFFVFQKGSLGIRIERDLAFLENCRISWGRIIKIEKEKILFEKEVLRKSQKNLFLKKQIKKISHQRSFLVNPKKDDLVTFHWGFAIEKISSKEKELLRYFTLEGIRFFEPSFFRKELNFRT